MNNKPFPNLDGREERTRQLRNAAMDLVGGEVEYMDATYMVQSLACRAATLGWAIDNNDLSFSELTQATNAYLGICKKIESGVMISGVGEADFLEAVASGVRSAVWDVATNATDGPCADFYESIKAGAESAFMAMGRKDDQSQNH